MTCLNVAFMLNSEFQEALCIRFKIISSFDFRFSKCETRNRLSVCNKLCYAVGGAPYQITGCALGFFLQIYLLDVALVSTDKSFYYFHAVKFKMGLNALGLHIMVKCHKTFTSQMQFK